MSARICEASAMTDAANSSCRASRAWSCWMVRWLRASCSVNTTRVFVRTSLLSANSASPSTAAVTAAPSAASLRLSELRRMRVSTDTGALTALPPALRERNVEIDGSRLAGGDVNAPRDRLDVLVPSDDDVVALGHVADREVVGIVGRCEERIGQHENDGAHIRMNVAEHLHGSRAIEGYRAGLPFRVAAEIEPLGAGRRRERKDVVIHVVFVREVDGRALENGQHMRHEPFVVLRDASVRRRFARA